MVLGFTLNLFTIQLKHLCGFVCVCVAASRHLYMFRSVYLSFFFFFIINCHELNMLKKDDDNGDYVLQWHSIVLSVLRGWQRWNEDKKLVFKTQQRRRRPIHSIQMSALLFLWMKWFTYSFCKASVQSQSRARPRKLFCLSKSDKIAPFWIQPIHLVGLALFFFSHFVYLQCVETETGHLVSWAAVRWANKFSVFISVGCEMCKWIIYRETLLFELENNNILFNVFERQSPVQVVLVMHG